MGDINAEKSRPPIVAVLGHVDHGKTTLLDSIRKANVASKEAGGITQSIGAYEILHNGKKITFIDTPGHEAFGKMRARGASAADLAILVIAADEGMKPQTEESIKILEETKTPFVVAITKTDKPGADIEKVKNELTAKGILLEGYGGRISYEPVSAKTGEGISELLDFILLTAEVENLTYHPDAPARGCIVETRVDRRRGLEATLILKDGTLKQGDPIRTATASGKIKILENFLGENVKSLEPSSPALVIGLETLPQIGEEFEAQESAAKSEKTKSGIVQMAARDAKGGVKTIRVLLKAADAGSLEALSQILRGMKHEKQIEIVGESVGDVVDNDVKFAIGAGAVILAFGNKTDKGARILAEANGVSLISADIIYDLVRVIEEFVASRGKPAFLGSLEVLAVFNQAKPEKQVVGGRVVKGVFKNKAVFEIKRGEEIAGTGRVTNLQQQKKDAGQVGEGNEAGLMVNSSVLLKVGDELIIAASA